MFCRCIDQYVAPAFICQTAVSRLSAGGPFSGWLGQGILRDTRRLAIGRRIACNSLRNKSQYPATFSYISAGIASMKADIHPEYREVIFQDLSSDLIFKTRSTIQSKETIKWEDGNEYPLVKVEVSSKSHPFYTGKHKIMDSGGRVDRFKQRYAKK